MTSIEQDPDLQLFYRDARSWADDRRERDSKSKRVAWIIAGVATTIAALEAIALAGLMPLKTVVPYTVLVDRQTGHVTTLDPSQPVRLAPDGALARSMLAQYVTARETADRSTVASDYRKVALWSGEAAKSAYLAQMRPGNLANPLQQVPRGITAQTRIKSVSLLEDGQALVRYDLVSRNDAGAEGVPAAYVSILHYRFRDRPLSDADRFNNPLGFEVIRYRRDAETLPAPSTQKVATSTEAGAASPTPSAAAEPRE